MEQQYLESLLVKVSSVYWVYYHQYCTRTKLNLVAETIAHDQVALLLFLDLFLIPLILNIQAALLEVAFICNITKHDEMLAAVLTPASPIDKTSGTLRAYVKLATTYVTFHFVYFFVFILLYMYLFILFCC